MTAEDFATSVERLLKQVGHWEQSRWSAPVSAATRPSIEAVGSGEGVARADVVHALVQHLADLAAAAEGGRRRLVPRVGDLTLPDQLRVMADDLVAAGAAEEALKLATEEVNAVRRAL